MEVNYKPKGWQTVIPYFLVEDCSAMIDFLVKTFNADVIEKMTMPDGKINHAEVRSGDSVVMMGFPQEEHRLSKVMLYVYVQDVDAVFNRAIEAGGISVRDPQDMFYGDRSGGVKDPFGNEWWISTHIEDLSTDEIQKRAASLGK